MSAKQSYSMGVGKVKLILQHKRKCKVSGIVFEVLAMFLTIGPSFLMSKFRPNLLPDSAGPVLTCTDYSNAYAFIKTRNDASG